MKKNRVTAAILAFFFGFIGGHKFYLNRPGQGILFILAFFFTATRMPMLTAIFGIIDAVRLLMMTDDQFDQKYNNQVQEWQSNRRRRTQQRNTRRQVRDRHRNQRREPARKEQDRFQREHRRRPASPPPRRQHKRSNPYKQSGIRRFKDYDITGAIEDFNKALEVSPNDASIHFNLACSYSLNEEPDKSFYHLSQAVENGFNDFEKIEQHEALAFLRIQYGYQVFKENGYKATNLLQAPKENLLDEDLLLKQLNKLAELRKKGLLTEEEFVEQKKRLMG